ncbi:Protein CBG27124 [Caenorhabditis briggsae]|uniref:Protein CBG27124 n=1 Tax=Caenorhabditis briggsae TaxID=6238 RepID=B6IHJ8_CAEBR|nr:Protein CBG27124 [Caenorhabditis briggsae]CAR99378.1 Protein CBG27124 [Caenorhabditis briggsae]
MDARKKRTRNGGEKMGKGQQLGE